MELKNIKKLNYNTMKEIRTEIEINAPKERVWEVLMDFEKHSEWNPFIKSIEGQSILGGKLKVLLTPPDTSEMTFKPKVVGYRENEQFAWQGKLFIKGIFDGRHIFELSDVNGGCKLVHREEFGGILAGALSSKVGENTKKGFEAMNRALKERAEA